MALSGSIAGAGSPRIHLDWSATQNIAGNYSDVTVVVYLKELYNVQFSATKYGSVTVNGTTKSFSTSRAFRGEGNWELTRQTFRVPHNADGTKSFAMSATYGIKITYSGRWLGSLSLSGSGTLNTIPRASGIGAISGGAVGGKVTVPISRASTGFVHDVFYTNPGGKQVQVATNVATSAAFTIPASDAGTMPNSDRGTGKIRVNTKSGGTVIGASYKNFTVTVPNTASYQPTIGAPSAVIAGNGHDKTIGKYVRGISKVVSSFTSEAQGGANVKSRSINIKRKSDGGDSRTTEGASVTSRTLALNGVYVITATIVDTRNRSKSETREITVENYSPPSVTSFTADRITGSNATNVTGRGSWTAFAGQNKLTIKVRSKEAVESLYTEFGSVDAGTTGSFTKSFTKTLTSEAKSYDFEIEVSDQFGNRDSSQASISTRKVPFSWGGDEGIGVGKVHERGALDVAGESFFDGPAEFLQTAMFSDGVEFRISGVGFTPSTPVESYPPGLSAFDTAFASGWPAEYGQVITHYYNNARVFQVLITHSGKDNLMYRLHHNASLGGWGPWRRLKWTESGENANGSWTRLEDGLQITETDIDYTLGSGDKYFALPAAFVAKTYSASVSVREDAWSMMSQNDKYTWATSGAQRVRFNSLSGHNGALMNFRVTCIGRWK